MGGGGGLGVGRVCPKAIQNTLLLFSGNHYQTWTGVYVVRDTSSKSEQQEGWEGGKANLCSLFPLSHTGDCHHWIKGHDGMVGDSDLHCTPPMKFNSWSSLDIEWFMTIEDFQINIILQYYENPTSLAYSPK